MYKRFQQFFQVLGVLALLGSAILLIWLYRMGILNNTNALKDWVAQYRFLAPLLFVFIQIAQIVIPIIPGGVTTVAGAMIFGPVWGFIYNYISIVIGSVLLFLLVRKYGIAFILLFIKEDEFRKYEKRLSNKTYERFFILCMISPVSPADILVMITGLTKMSLRRFLIIILLAKPFSIIGYSYLWVYGSRIADYFLQLLN